MTDNLILSQKDVSLMLMVSDYFLYLTAHFNYYNSAYRAAVAASRVINNLNVVPQDCTKR
jgi:hypothetical protein